MQVNLSLKTITAAKKESERFISHCEARAAAKKESERFISHCEALASGRKEIETDLEQAYQEHLLNCDECDNE